MVYPHMLWVEKFYDTRKEKPRHCVCNGVEQVQVERNIGLIRWR